MNPDAPNNRPLLGKRTSARLEEKQQAKDNEGTHHRQVQPSRHALDMNQRLRMMKEQLHCETESIADSERRMRKALEVNALLRQRCANSPQLQQFTLYSPLSPTAPVVKLQPDNRIRQIPVIPAEANNPHQDPPFVWVPPYGEWFEEYGRKLNLPAVRKVDQAADFRKVLDRNTGPKWYDVIETPGDGECFFHAVSQFMSVTPEFNWQIRDVVCDFVVENRKILGQFYPGEIKEVNDAQYKQRRMEPTATDPPIVAESIDIYAIACLLGIDVWAWSPSVEGGPCDTWTVVSPHPDLKTSEFAMYVRNDKSEHFSLIINM